MSHHQVNTHDCHSLDIQLLSAESVVRYDRVCKFLGRLDENLEGRLGFVLVDSEQVSQRNSLGFFALLVLQNSPTQPDVIISINPNSQVVDLLQFGIAKRQSALHNNNWEGLHNNSLSSSNFVVLIVDGFVKRLAFID